MNKTIIPPAQTDIFSAIAEEVRRASKHGTEFSNLHEAYSVILEEVDELWDITRQKKKLRKRNEIEAELIQIAAMAVKALGSVGNFVGGDV